MATTENTI